MAAKTSRLHLKDIISVFKILSNTDRSKVVELSLDIVATNNFDELLILNLYLLWQALESDKNLQSLGELNLLKTQFCGLFSSEEKRFNNFKSVRWAFCQICLQMLRLLKKSLRVMNSDKNIKSPGIDLSVSEQQIVKTVIQLIVVLGICPNLLPGVGLPIEQRSGFSHDLNSGQEFSRCPKCLYNCIMTLVDCLGEPSLSLLILSKHLADILASLMQLAYCNEVCEEVGFVKQLNDQPESAAETNLIDLNLGNGNVKSVQHNELTDQELTEVCDDVKDLQGQGKLGTDKKLIVTRQQNSTSESQEQGKGTIEGMTTVNSVPKSSQVIIEQNQSEMSNDKNVCFGGILISKEQQDECKKALNNIINKMYQPLVVRELLFLQGNMSGQTAQKPKELHGGRPGSAVMEKKPVPKTPKWMKDVCGHLLSKSLTKKNGVQSVLRAVLEGSSGAASEWKICEAIAQVIANCPIQMHSPDEYYKSISPQVLSLLQLPSTKLQQQYTRATVVTIQAMLRKYPEIATKYIADPLMRPFHIAIQEPGKNSRAVLVDEREMTRCIEGLHKVFVASPNSSEVMTENMQRIIVPVFELFCFVRKSASHVKTALLELLSTFFKRTNNLTALSALYIFICQTLPDSQSTNSFLSSGDNTKHSEVIIPQINLMANSCTFGYGENGGVILQKRHSLEIGTNENAFEEMFGREGESYEIRALCLVEVLQNLRKEEIPGNFFLYLLQQVQEIILNPNFREIGKIKTLVIFNVLALMCEKLGPSVLKNTGDMITFIETTLTRAHHVYKESLDAASGAEVFELQTLTMALGMLSALLGGAVKIEASDYAKLQALTPILREIANNHAEREITEQANDLLVVILTKTTVLHEKTSANHKEATRKAKSDEKGERKAKSNTDNGGTLWTAEGEQGVDFDTAFEQLCDPLLPVRGHALMRLASLLKTRDPKALEKVDILLKTFRDSLIHDDTYIYLAAVEGLVAAADVRTDDVLPYLAQEYHACSGEGTEATGGEQKMDKGEYNLFEKAKDKREFGKRSSTTRLKVGEALMRAVKCCGELVPRYFQILVQAFLVGVRDEESFIRASSLSNLGEMCRLSPHMLPSVVHEVFHCLNVVLRSDQASEVRQAAVLVLTLVLKGLGAKATTVLSDNLKDIYQLLKFVESSDKDETTRVHAQVALGELQSIMKDQLFPQQRLVKHINVLR